MPILPGCIWADKWILPKYNTEYNENGNYFDFGTYNLQAYVGVGTHGTSRDTDCIYSGYPCDAWWFTRSIHSIFSKLNPLHWCVGLIIEDLIVEINHNFVLQCEWSSQINTFFHTFVRGVCRNDKCKPWTQTQKVGQIVALMYNHFSRL
jgi:hypothetical protein